MIYFKLIIIRIIIFIYFISNCENALFESKSDTNNLVDFEQAWQGIDAVYPYFEIKNIDWNQIYQEYRAKAETAQGDDIYNILIDLISELKDQHPYIKFLVGRQTTIYFSPRYKKDRDLFDATVIKKYFDKKFFFAGEGFIEYQILPDNIGYMNISSFSPQNLAGDFNKYWIILPIPWVLL